MRLLLLFFLLGAALVAGSIGNDFTEGDERTFSFDVKVFQVIDDTVASGPVDIAHEHDLLSKVGGAVTTLSGFANITVHASTALLSVFYVSADCAGMQPELCDRQRAYAESLSMNPLRLTRLGSSGWVAEDKAAGLASEAQASHLALSRWIGFRLELSSNEQFHLASAGRIS